MGMNGAVSDQVQMNTSVKTLYVECSPYNSFWTFHKTSVELAKWKKKDASFLVSIWDFFFTLSVRMRITLVNAGVNDGFTFHIYMCQYHWTCMPSFTTRTWFIIYFGQRCSCLCGKANITTFCVTNQKQNPCLLLLYDFL